MVSESSEAAQRAQYFSSLRSSGNPPIRDRHLDITDPDGQAVAIEEAESRFGLVNALFNNAGILHSSAVAACSPQHFRHVIDVNLYGVFLGIHCYATALRRAGGGMIVNTSSTAGLQGYARLAAYVASKWAGRALSKAAALDLVRDRTRVLSLHPGPIRTPMTDDVPEPRSPRNPFHPSANRKRLRGWHGSCSLRQRTRPAANS